MELRHILLIVVIMMIGITAIPSIYSLFVGQHSFYSTGTPICSKCHADIQQELDSSAHHLTLTCDTCHTLNTSSNFTHGNMINLRCLDCHGFPPRAVKDTNGNTLIAPIAKIFGESVPNEESHNPFISSAIASNLLKGENEACISCHTKKSLSISMLYADTYKFNANRISDGTWQLSNYLKNTELASPVLAQSSESIGQHSFPLTSSLECEKCHSNVRSELNNSFHHTYFSCSSCHQLSSVYHASSTPSCLTCHGTTPGSVTDQKGNTFIAPVADVYADNQAGADAHIAFVQSANNTNVSTGNNIACSSCHSSFNNNIIYSRPSSIEWDVVNSSGAWNIQNLAIGTTKEVKVTKYQGGKVHNLSTSSNVDCISCHEDIKQAVISGGHSNEKWKLKHNYANYTDMNSYCKSCHKPITQNNNGTLPYPTYPFNSINHGAIKITCMDCHGKSGSLLAEIDGVLQTPAYNSLKMGGIETSVTQQPSFVQSYLCIACKNTGNPVPNNLIHFKVLTEPQITIYVNGTQQYP